MAKPARPTDCKPDICDLARKFCMLGATDEDLAELFEVEPATIADWIAGFPDFGAALKYAVSGFVDQLRQQLHTVKFQQWDVAWQNFVWEMLGDRKIHDRTNRRQIKLVLALSQRTGYVPRNEIRRLTPALAELYAGKTAKTLSRDINALEKIKPFPLIETSPEGVRATKETILAFLPRTRKGDFEAQLQEAQRLAEEAKQFSFDFGELATSSRAAAASA
jgi:hypothetical protein